MPRWSLWQGGAASCVLAGVGSWVLAGVVSCVLAGAALAEPEPGLTIELVDLHAHGGGSATVGVALSGIEMVDPVAAKERPARGQGHLHYRVDDGPVVATTVTRLSFHELAAGAHRIEVALVGNDHRPLGPREVLEVTIPAEASASR